MNSTIERTSGAAVAGAAPCSAITAREFEVMAHALGSRGKEPGYRNHFCTGQGSDDYPACESLVAKGLMERHARRWMPDYIYTVTPAGRVFVLPNGKVSDAPDSAAPNRESKL